MSDSNVTSGVKDLRDLGLDEIAASTTVVTEALARVVPSKDEHRAPVAAFQSSV